MNLNFETDGLNFNSKGKPDEIATQIHICRDMSNLFDYKDCNRKIWMDMYCKTGNTLEALKKHGVNKENIIAICDNKQSQMLVCRKLYGKLLPEIDCRTEINTITRRGQVYYVSDYKNTIKDRKESYIVDIFRTIKEQYMLEFTSEDNFKFDNIIMNPPYNPSDLYIDFVTLAHKIASEHVVAITPAKGINGKSDKKNDEFRQNIVPYIEKAVFYPNTRDIFDISEGGGISYYLLSDKKSDIKYIKTICNKGIIMRSDYEEHDELKLCLYNRKLLSIIGKVGTLGEGFKQSLYVKNTDHGEETIAGTLGFKRCTFVGEQDRGENKILQDYVEVMQGESVCGYKKKSELFTKCNIDKYKCITSIIISGGGGEAYDSDGKFSRYFNCYIIGPNQVPKGSFPVLKYFDTKSEADSFVSYTKTKLFQFLFILGVCGTTLTREFFRFVPDPVKFDHIFTDAELYQKYDLTPDEIAIIESVIKERK